MKGFRDDVFYRCPVCGSVHSEENINIATIKACECDGIDLEKVKKEVESTGESQDISLLGIDNVGDAYCPDDKDFSRIKNFICTEEI